MNNLINKNEFINDENSIIQKFINNPKDIKIEFYLFRKLRENKGEYESLELTLKEDIIDFLKENLSNDFEELTIDSKFHVSNYNDEFQINDTLASLDINENENIKQRFDKMKQSLSEDKLNVERAKFQTIRLIDETNNKTCYIFYYQGTKKMASNKKLRFISTESYDLVESDLVKIGGSLDFIIDENGILYIKSPRPFEWTFDYNDHINEKRDENIKKIIDTQVFIDKEAEDIFREEANKYIRSRSLASMDENLFESFQEYFTNIVNELEIMKENDEEMGILEELYNFIDFENVKIKINDSNKENINTVFLLFQNKIVEALFTKEIKASIGYMES